MSDRSARPAEGARALHALVVGILGVWRIAHLVAAEDGPWDVVVRLRTRAGSSQWGDLMDCFKCLSLWVAAPFAVVLGQNWSIRCLMWPALSAGAIVLDEARACRFGRNLEHPVENPVGG
jgi:hypothetical protein